MYIFFYNTDYKSWERIIYRITDFISHQLFGKNYKSYTDYFANKNDNAQSVIYEV